MVCVFDQEKLAHKARALIRRNFAQRNKLGIGLLNLKKLPFLSVYLIFYMESICMNCLFYLALLTESVSLHYFPVSFEMLIWHFVAFFLT